MRPALEKLKLEDGVRIHEHTKVQLDIYARENMKPLVKPFMLVVAKDTTHANDLQRRIEAEDFFGGRYKGRVITVHSNQTGGGLFYKSIPQRQKTAGSCR